MPPILHLWNLGRIGYRPALKIQESLAQSLKNADKSGAKKTHYLLTLEHDPVYTTGIRTSGYTREEENRLISLGADFVRTNRGGLITFHGPGQLVVYPVMHLRDLVPKSHSRKSMLGNLPCIVFSNEFSHNEYVNSGLGMKWYINTLEQVIIDLCKDFDIEANRSPHTGVWIGDNKVCAMGVRNSGFITTHGLALNCNPDLSWFSHIIPCGIENKGVTSLSQELGRDVRVSEVMEPLVKNFENHFQCSIVTLPKN